MLSLNIPKNINILLNENWIEIKGPLGIIKKKKSNLIKIYFYASMINKLLWGVWKGYSIKLNIVGVGYKAVIENDILSLKLGFSHNVIYNIPKDIKIKVLAQKQLTIVVFGKDFQKVTQTAAEIKSLKPVEPYKGKGIKYFNEVVKLKEGKKTNV